MAARPGEENVATLFGDIHYFYGPETDNPPHHRFNKGSYVYLFENAQEGRARIEVANQPGTEYQDAFDGFLDRTAVTYTYKHSCMVSLAVRDVPNQDEWHLPTYDPHNQNIYHYKLHSLDIYFWTPRDAQLFVNGVRRVLPASQLDITDEPIVPAPPPQQRRYPAPPAANNGTSSLVQKLESVALNGGGDGAPAGGAPPLSAVSADSSHPPGSRGAASGPQQQPAFAPIAYNPAAPAAPEAIRPREKTPPPEDVPGGHVHPLHQTLAQDASTPFSPGLVVPSGLGPLSPGVPPPAFNAPPGAPAFPAPPAYTASAPAAASPFPPSLIRSATMPVTSPSPFSPQFPGSPLAVGYAPPPTTAITTSAPSAPPATTAVAAVPPPPASTHDDGHDHASPPPAGFSHYSYSSQRPAGAASAPVDFSIHQQLYRPTEGEHTSHHTPKKDPRGKLEEYGGKVERGVTGMLKRLEKKIG